MSLNRQEKQMANKIIKHSDIETLRSNPELRHFGILGMKWGVRRYQNKDGSLTPQGKKRISQIDKQELQQHETEKLRRSKIPDLTTKEKEALSITEKDLDYIYAKIMKIPKNLLGNQYKEHGHWRDFKEDLNQHERLTRWIQETRDKNPLYYSDDPRYKDDPWRIKDYHLETLQFKERVDKY